MRKDYKNYSNRILWSPDSRYIMVCRRQPVPKRYVHYVESSPNDRLQPILHKQEYAKPGDRLPQRTPIIIDTHTGCKVEADMTVCDNQYELNYFRWQPDSREVTMLYNRRGHKTAEHIGYGCRYGQDTYGRGGAVGNVCKL